MDKEYNILSLDYGNKRIGLAVASSQAKIAKPFKTIVNNNDFLTSLNQIIESENIKKLIIGLPKSLEGNETKQTKIIIKFTNELKVPLNIPIFFQDEADTSKRAEEELFSKTKTINKEEVDALSATYILEDWINDQSRMNLL